MESIFSIDEMNEILFNYSLGEFNEFKQIIKNDVVSFCQVIKTDEKFIFMKVLRKFNETIKNSLEICFKLKLLGFPTYETYLTNNKELYFEYKDYKIVFYEFFPQVKNEWKYLNKEQSYDFGKTLANFHTMSKNLIINKMPHEGNFNNIFKLAKQVYKKSNYFNKEIQNSISWIKIELEKMNLNLNQYETGYFSEFNPGHIHFEKNKVMCVLDWMIGYEEAILDIGSAMIIIFNKNKTINYDNLILFIKGYNEQRKLTKIEIENLFDGFKFGAIKYILWGFIDLNNGNIVDDEIKIDNDELLRLKTLMKFNKEDFLKNINLK